jgi:hyperosmotically inducible protein
MEELVMRLIRRLLLLVVVGAGGLMAVNYLSDHGWTLHSTAATLATDTAKERATKLASRAAAKANDAASTFGDVVSDGALTAKIKSKMALDDSIRARAINVDTSGATVTLRGTVRSTDERERAERLAAETEGVTRVVNRLQVKRS